MMNDIFKAVSWGIALLILSISVLISILIILTNFDHHVSNREMVENKNLAQKVLPSLKMLDDIAYRNPNSMMYELRQSPVVKETEEYIVRSVGNCKECSDLRTPFFFEKIDYQHYYDYLKNMSDEKHISSINSTAATMICFAILSIALELYLLTALFKYKALGAKRLTIFFAIVAPIFALAFSASISMEFFTKFGNANYISNSTATIVFLATLLSLFVIYPPAFISARKSGTSIKKILFFNRSEV